MPSRKNRTNKNYKKGGDLPTVPVAPTPVAQTLQLTGQEKEAKINKLKEDIEKMQKELDIKKKDLENYEPLKMFGWFGGRKQKKSRKSRR